MIRNEVKEIDGVVDARIIQRLDYPQYVIKVDRAKSAQLGLTQADVMKTVIAALNSSIQFNKHNFWIDPKSKNQYFVGVSYFEKDIESIDTCSTFPITSPVQNRPVPMRNVVTVDRTSGGHRGHALQHPADHRADDGRRGPRPGARLRRRRQGPQRFGETRESGPSGRPTIPTSKEKKDAGRDARSSLSGEYLRMTDTFQQPGRRAWSWRRS